jgi:hypothetical protein
MIDSVGTEFCRPAVPCAKDAPYLTCIKVQLVRFGDAVSLHKRYRAMLGGSRATVSHRRGAARRLLAASLAALFVLVVLVLSGAAGEAQACPPGTKSHHAATKDQPRTSVVAAHPWSGKYLGTEPVVIGHCCGGSSSSADASCKAGCCSSGAAVAAQAPDGRDCFDIPTSYFLPAQGDLTSLAPPAHFRPPQAVS